MAMLSRSKTGFAPLERMAGTYGEDALEGLGSKSAVWVLQRHNTNDADQWHAATLTTKAKDTYGPSYPLLPTSCVWSHSTESPVWGFAGGAEWAARPRTASSGAAPGFRKPPRTAHGMALCVVERRSTFPQRAGGG